jgi:hypothetical protein
MDWGMLFEISQLFIAEELAQKLRQLCLLGLKVSDSDQGVETIIFRLNDATNAMVMLVF